jgi:hypothetical protein
MSDGTITAGDGGLPDPGAGALIAQGAPATEADPGLVLLADDMATCVASFIATVDGISQGGSADEAIALLLLETAELARFGARLGAITDVVPEGPYEPDAGREPDVERIRSGLHELFGPVDSFLAVDDPYAAVPVVGPESLSDDLSETVADLLHGLAHHAAGRVVEALWWWQYQYLASWGETCLRALGALHALVAHVRLEGDD